MTANANTRVVEAYMEAFNRLDHATVLSCLSDDVEWIVPGQVHLHGKAAFAAEIDNPTFEGKPEITVARLVADGDTVVAEGSVRTQLRGGEALTIAYCDVFVLRDGRIRRLTSYLVPLAAAQG